MIDILISSADVTNNSRISVVCSRHIYLSCMSQVGCGSPLSLPHKTSHFRAPAEGVAPIWDIPFSRQKAEIGQTTSKHLLTRGGHPFHSHPISQSEGQCKGQGRKHPWKEHYRSHGNGGVGKVQSLLTRCPCSPDGEGGPSLREHELMAA